MINSVIKKIENKLKWKDYYNIPHGDIVWFNLSYTKDKLSDDFMWEFRYNFYWNELLHNQKCGLKLLWNISNIVAKQEFNKQNKLNFFSVVSHTQNLSEAFMRHFKDLLDWNGIAYQQKFSKEFFNEFHSEFKKHLYKIAINKKLSIEFKLSVGALEKNATNDRNRKTN